MTSLELVEKLAVLVPPPRVNLVRYHGVFAPGSKLRSMVVPGGAGAAQATGCPHLGETTAAVAEGKPPQQLTTDKTSRVDWASLLNRVFQTDILARAPFGGRMKVTAVIEQPDVVAMPSATSGCPRCPRASPSPGSQSDSWTSTSTPLDAHASGRRGVPQGRGQRSPDPATDLRTSARLQRQSPRLALG